MNDLVERLTNAANALVVLRQGVTLEAAKTLPPTDPVIVADILEEAADRIEELERQRLMILSAVYREAPRFVATICDEQLDRSGALLGEVRKLSNAALTGDKP